MTTFTQNFRLTPSSTTLPRQIVTEIDLRKLISKLIKGKIF